MTINELPNDVIEDIIRRNTVITEFDLKLSHIDVQMKIKKIKKELTEALSNANGRHQEL